MVFLRKCTIQGVDYYYLYHTTKFNGQNIKCKRYIGSVKPSEARFEDLARKFLSDIQQSPTAVNDLHSRNVVELLQFVQAKHQYLPQEELLRLSKELGVPGVDLYGVGTFYSMFSLTRPAKHKIRICDGTACHVRGSPKLIETLKKELGVGPGEVTPDGIFSFELVRCLGLCASAPLMMVDEQLYPKLDDSRIKEIVESYKEESQ